LTQKAVESSQKEELTTDEGNNSSPLISARNY
jgi:hypothetical protein